MQPKKMHLFYKGIEWRTFRKKILTKHPNCFICGAKATTVHHLIPLDMNNLNNKNISLNERNCIALCEHCHNAVHKKGNE